MGVWLEMLGPRERSSTRDELVRSALGVVVCLLVL